MVFAPFSMACMDPPFKLYFVSARLCPAGAVCFNFRT